MKPVRRVVFRLYLTFLILLPAAAAWVWVGDGMWTHGAMPTHGLVHVTSACAMALFLRGVTWAGRTPP